jgi:hypothetical protein
MAAGFFSLLVFTILSNQSYGNFGPDLEAMSGTSAGRRGVK